MVAERNRAQARAYAIRTAFTQALEQLGYERTTVAEVARRAEVAPGLVHYHFHDKRGLLHAVFRGQSARTHGQLRDRTSWKHEPRDQVLAAVDALLGLGSDRALQVVWLVAMADAVQTGHLRRQLWELLERDAAELERCVREMSRIQDPEAVTAGLLALIHGTLARMAVCLEPPVAASLAEDARRAAVLLLDGAERATAAP